jgi:hypothetical protein
MKPIRKTHPATLKLKRLLKAYSFARYDNYLDRIIELFKLDDIKSAKLMFKDIPNEYKKEGFKYLVFSGDFLSELQVFDYFFELI